MARRQAPRRRPRRVVAFALVFSFFLALAPTASASGVVYCVDAYPTSYGRTRGWSLLYKDHHHYWNGYVATASNRMYSNLYWSGTPFVPSSGYYYWDVWGSTLFSEVGSCPGVL